MPRSVRGNRIWLEGVLREDAMPQYNYVCQDCKKEFTAVLTITEHEAGKVECPHCHSKNVEQQWATFYAVTGKKS